MPLVRSRLRQNHHLPAGPLAEFRSVRVALHVEFPHRIHSQKHSAGSAGLHIVFGGARKFHAIQQKKILLWALPETAKLFAVVEFEIPVPPVFSDVKFTIPGLSGSNRS